MGISWPILIPWQKYRQLDLASILLHFVAMTSDHTWKHNDFFTSRVTAKLKHLCLKSHVMRKCSECGTSYCFLTQVLFCSPDLLRICYINGAWWCISLIPAETGGSLDFRASLVYKTNSWIARTTQGNPVFRGKTKQTKKVSLHSPG